MYRPSQEDKIKARAQKPISKHVIAILSLLTIAVFGFCLWLLATGGRQNSYVQPYTKIADEPSEQELHRATLRDDKCTPNDRLYTSEALGIIFCYPIAWGNVTLEDVRLSKNDTGYRWSLGFTSKPAIRLGFVSDDWQTAVTADNSCRSPVQQLPNPVNFSKEWTLAGNASAYRGIYATDAHWIEELADEDNGGACLRGYGVVNGPVYKIATLSYFREFGTGVINPVKHSENPDILIPLAERATFKDVLLSLEKY